LNFGIKIPYLILELLNLDSFCNEFWIQKK
jgi:hypothetical protein